MAPIIRGNSLYDAFVADNWKSASTFAENHYGGYLTSISSASENQFVLDNFRNITKRRSLKGYGNGLDMSVAYIGISSDSSIGKLNWRWESQDDYSFFNWGVWTSEANPFPSLYPPYSTRIRIPISEEAINCANSGGYIVIHIDYEIDNRTRDWKTVQTGDWIISASDLEANLDSEGYLWKNDPYHAFNGVILGDDFTIRSLGGTWSTYDSETGLVSESKTPLSEIIFPDGYKTNYDLSIPFTGTMWLDSPWSYSRDGAWEVVQENQGYSANNGAGEWAIAEIPLTLSTTLPTAIKEGAGLFITSINLSAGTKTSANLAEGAQVWWKVTGITQDDLASGALTGTGTITKGKLDIQHSLIADADNGENFEVSFFSDAEMTQQIGATSSTTIQEGKDLVLRYRGQEYLLTSEYGKFIDLYARLTDEPWTKDNSDGLARAVSEAVSDWFGVRNDLTYDRYYQMYGGGILPIFIAYEGNSFDSTLYPGNYVSVLWCTSAGYAVGENAKNNISHYYINSTPIGAIGSFELGPEVKLIEINSRPIDLSLTSSGILENSFAGTVIGTLSATDPDAGSTFTYALATGNGTNDTDNSLVTISGNQILVKSGAVIDFETNPVLNLYFRVSDNGNPGLVFDKAVTASVIDINESPTDLAFTSTGVQENSAAGTFIGTLSATDPDAGSSFTYALVAGNGTNDDADNSLVEIVGNEVRLKSGASIDFETNPLLNLNIRVTHNGNPGLTFIKAVGISVLNANDVPTGIPTTTGTSKVGSTITIDTTAIKDADNFSGYTPTYNYSFEVSNDNGTTWTKLTSTDATDNNSTLTLTTAEVGKQIRGVVSYMDGFGTNEVVTSDASTTIASSAPPTRQLSTASSLTAKVGQIIEVPIRIDQAVDLQALDLTFAFGPSLFSIPPAGALVLPGVLTPDWSFSANVNATTKVLTLSGYGTTALTSGSGELAKLRLQVNGNAKPGTTTLDLISASLNENAFSATLIDGSLLITAPKLSIAQGLGIASGRNALIPVNIDDAAGVQSIDLKFAYDPTIFSLPTSTDIITPGALNAGWTFTANTSTPGLIQISGFGTSSLTTGSGSLLNLNLKVKSGLSAQTASLDLVSVSLNEGGISADLIDGTLQVLPPTFQVLAVRQTLSGVALQLTEAPNLDRLNLYDGQDAAIDLPDLKLTRADGSNVDKLSLHWQGSTSELHLIRTDSLTGINQSQFNTGGSLFKSDSLAAGTYTLTIDSRSDGLVSASKDEIIDGNGDGIGGDAFSQTFTRTSFAHTLSIGDTARGPGQALSLNGLATTNAISGLPVLLSTTASLKQLQGTINFDASVISSTNLLRGKDLPADWSLQIEQTSPGVLSYTASGTTAITGTDKEFFRFAGTVSQSAPYGSSTLIQATVTAPQAPSISFETDPALVLLAYSGDTTGNKTLSSLDASRVQRVVVGLDSGFDPYDTYSPILIGDTTGNGGLSSLDAARIQQQLVGLPADSFPTIPAILLIG